MKRLLLITATLIFASCDRSPTPAPRKEQSVLDIPSPTSAPPPVQASSYDDGYKAGDLAGEASAKAQRVSHPKERPVVPESNELDVLALEAAGTDVTRAEKWQRGFVAGFKDGFARVAEGRR